MWNRKFIIFSYMNLILNSDMKTCTHSKLFNGTLKEQKYIVNILMKNELKYNEYTQDQDSSFEPLMFMLIFSLGQIYIDKYIYRDFYKVFKLQSIAAVFMIAVWNRFTIS